jgi:hypothetical protein
MITPMARSSMFPLIAKSLNSLSIDDATTFLPV